jgi:circadian clock protein KaiC
MVQAAHRSERFVHILKYRGSGFIEGQHTVTINGEGMRVFPRLEALAANTMVLPPSAGRLKLGVPELDAMLGGGLPSGTATLVVGPSGIGKTTIGLHFIANSSENEPGLIFNFYEAAEQLRAKSEALGLALGPLLDAGHVEVERHAPTEQRLDVLVYRLLTLVRERGVKRVLIDGIDGFAQSVTDPERLPRVMAALSSALRQEGATVVYTLEQPALTHAGDSIPFSISSAAQNILLARYVELDSEIRRGLLVLKMRGSVFERKIREFEITSQGMRIGSVLPSGMFLRDEPSMQKN